ncbi:hypothetical protein [Paenibacillus durus]|uniref:Uncharacterized protein n=1 Tax=Paenibacillus durus TaxID=44251 RepID=A0A089HTW0_PAEDU|nr:hypothetical protein [Paenibacillus durus]AIQ13798.1 hypothetical protein PDUR_19165 [Paenibacillus durus]
MTKRKIAPIMLALCAEKLEKLQADYRIMNRQTNFSIQLGGVRYKERAQAGEVLLLLTKVTEMEQTTKTIGQFRSSPAVLPLIQSIMKLGERTRTPQSAVARRYELSLGLKI